MLSKIPGIVVGTGLGTYSKQTVFVNISGSSLGYCCLGARSV